MQEMNQGDCDPAHNTGKSNDVSLVSLVQGPRSLFALSAL